MAANNANAHVPAVSPVDDGEPLVLWRYNSATNRVLREDATDSQWAEFLAQHPGVVVVQLPDQLDDDVVVVVNGY